MKQAFLLSVAAVLIAVLLPITQSGYAHQVPPSPSPALTADKDITFTVQGEDGVVGTNLRDYLPGVLAGEMPALFAEEALMAQTVAARTYILHRMQHPSGNHPHADICDDPACCKAYASETELQESWGDNYDTYWARITNAVAATDGLYLTYDSQPIEAVFHSSSMGATESSEAIWNHRPYLVSVESPETPEDVPNLVTEVVFSPTELKTALTAKFPDLEFSDDPSAWLTEPLLTESGRVDTLTICGTPLKGTQIRSALGLRSSDFTADFAEGVFTFTVSGYGHGVGMSQYGANIYAKQGWSFEEILAHYYPDTQLSSAAG